MGTVRRTMPNAARNTECEIIADANARTPSPRNPVSRTIMESTRAYDNRFVSFVFICLPRIYAPLREKTSIGAVFAIIPVVIVAVILVLVLSTNLDVGLLRYCGGHHR
jgi:hypothetical protein